MKVSCKTCAFFTRDFGHTNARDIPDDEPLCGLIVTFIAKESGVCGKYMKTGTDTKGDHQC